MLQQIWVKKQFVRTRGFSNEDWSVGLMGMFTPTLHRRASISSPLIFAAIDQNDIVRVLDAGEGWVHVLCKGINGFMLIV